MELTTQSWILLAAVAVVVGISKTGLPGIGILSVVMTIWALGQENANHANGALLILLLTGDVFAVAWYRRHANWHHLFRLLPPAVAGIIVGYLLARGLQHFKLEKHLGRVIGGIIMALLIVNAWWTRRRPRVSAEAVAAANSLAPGVPHHWSFAVAVGGLAGIATMLANAAGPLLVIYLLAMRLDKHAFIGTSAWYFLLLNSFKVPFMVSLGWINPETLRLNLALAPVVIVGALLGVVLLRYIPQRVFRVVVELVAAAGALKLTIG